MPNFRVSWVIDVESDTPIQAAGQARDAQVDPESAAVIFKVRLLGKCPVCGQRFYHKRGCGLGTGYGIGRRKGAGDCGPGC